MTGRTAYELAHRTRNRLDLARLLPVEELAIMLGSGPAAARVWAFLQEDPTVAELEPAELATLLVDQLPGVGKASAVRAAVWLRGRAPTG
ncbi:MAG TPA: hypothetical protein VKA64_02900 [Gammaproteobacteria bacterium]|nr:hypothetical protein [Gammaproteobacteria bacterium]